MREYRYIIGCLIVLLTCVLYITGCKDERENKQKILYEDIMECRVLKRYDKEQRIAIPLILNKKAKEINITGVDGINVDINGIIFEWGDEHEYDGVYCYTAFMTIPWSENIDKKGDVKIQSLNLNIDGDEFVYNPGIIELVDEIINNKDEDLIFGGFGTGYPDIDKLDMSLYVENDIEITDIVTTLDFKLENVSDYLKKYPGGTKVDFLVRLDGKNCKKLHYVWDVSIKYICDGEERVYTFDIMSAQTSISYRFEDYIKEHKR